MASNKRHQARNEQALQDLVRNVTGNDRCADCNAPNPGWASWSLGIFLCVRCGSLHRKLGTHISKVKSLSMDSWAVDQVDVMRRNGNVTSNKKFNPRNTKPPIPMDADEVDSAMERFIRQKYEQKTFMEGAPTNTVPLMNDAGARMVHSIDQGDDVPPPPPPKSPRSKPGKLFGILPTRSKNKDKDGMRKSSASAAPGKVVSATFGVSDEGLEWKLIQLREMGFPDEKRNSSILKGVNGDLERAIESLVRLGEGSGPSLGRVAPQELGRKNTPTALQLRRDEGVMGASTGAHRAETPPVHQQPASARPATTQNDDVWANIAPASAPLQQPPQQQQLPLENAFRNMQLSQASQGAVQASALFPNATGGHALGFPPQQPAPMASMTQSVPQLAPQGNYNNPYGQANAHNPFAAAPSPQMPHSANPFQASQPMGMSNPFLQNAPQVATPFGVQHQMPYQQPSTPQPTLQQQMLQQQPMQHNPFQAGGAQQWTNAPPQPSPTQYAPTANYFTYAQPQNPYGGSATYPGMPQPTMQGYPQQQQQQQPPLANRMDKNSIMALYNYPQAAPQASSPRPMDASGMSTQASSPGPLGPGSPGVPMPPTRSVTMPVAGSKNPFATSMPPTAAMAPEASGRHSPDAFANLSAQFVR